jgi:hypothetical protein
MPFSIWSVILMKKTITLITMLLICAVALGQTDSGSQHFSQPPSWQTVLIVAIIALALALVGYGGTRALNAIATSAYMQGAAPKAPESFNAFFLQSARIAIVGVIVMATVVLALFDKLDKGAIGVLSGVAGYVLGGADRTKTSRQEPNNSGARAEGKDKQEAVG